MLAESQDLGYFLYFLNFIFILVGDLGGGLVKNMWCQILIIIIIIN